jgi:hypothetical protein
MLRKKGLQKDDIACKGGGVQSVFPNPKHNTVAKKWRSTSKVSKASIVDG